MFTTHRVVELLFCLHISSSMPLYQESGGSVDYFLGGGYIALIKPLILAKVNVISNIL